MCTKGRDVISTTYSLALTRNSLFKTNNSNHLSPPCYPFPCFPPSLYVGTPSVPVHETHKHKSKPHSEYSIVARVRPRASKGITDLLLPLPSFNSCPIKSPSKKSTVILLCLSLTIIHHNSEKPQQTNNQTQHTSPITAIYLVSQGLVRYRN